MDVFKTPIEASKVLVVEDSDTTARYYKRLLAARGFHDVKVLQDSREAIETFLSYQPDLVILDLHMPNVDGFEILGGIGQLVAPGSFHPILVVSGDLEPSARVRCLSAGAKDFISKPFRPDEFMLRVQNLLETRLLHQHLHDRKQALETRMVQENAKLQETQMEILHRLAVAAECRDDETGRHSMRVGMSAARIGMTLGLPDEEVDFLEQAAPLHDVGKVGIPDSILLSPNKLTDEQFETMKTHTTIGGLILSREPYPLLGCAREIALTHHEKFDGSGYPSGLAGQAIPISGRIVAVADVFDSLCHKRSYKPAFSVPEAIDIMTMGRGSHFDPEVFDAFMHLVTTGAMADLVDDGKEGALPFGGAVAAGAWTDVGAAGTLTSVVSARAL